MNKSPSGIILLIIIIVILIVLLGLRMAGIFTFDVVADLNDSSSNSFVNDIGKDYFDEIRKDNAVVENLNKLLSK